MFFKQFLLFLDLRGSHVSEFKIMFPNIKRTEVVCFCHRQALCWANGCAQSAETTFSHVNIKLGGINPFGCAIRSATDFFSGSYRFNSNAINRTNLYALIANNTIVNFIMEFITPGIRHRKNLMRVLNGGNTILLVEVIFILNGKNLFASTCL